MTSKKLFNEGLHTYRFPANPEEKRFAEAWEAGNDPPSTPVGQYTLEYLLGDGIDPVEVTERERVVAATVIQWLGSEVGQFFLRQLGYKKESELSSARNAKLKVAIISSGLTQYEAAQAIGVSETHLSRIVQGRREATESEQKMLSNLLKCPREELFP